MECDVVFDYKIANTIFIGTANYRLDGFILYTRNTSPTYITSEVSGVYANFRFDFDINTRYDIKLNIKSSNTSYKTTWINNTLYENNIQCNAAISKSLPVYLFKGPYTDRNNAKMKFYGAKFYKDGVITNDLRPVLHNKRPAMYDVITKKFHYNIGAGEFTYKRLVPEQYILLDGIENREFGYINTQIIADKTTRMDATVTIPESDLLKTRNNWGSTMIGCRDNSSPINGFHIGHTTDGYFNGRCYNSNYVNTTSITNTDLAFNCDEKYVVSLDARDATLSINGNILHTFEHTATEICNANIFIFSRNAVGFGSVDESSCFILHHLIISKNGKVIAEYYPVEDRITKTVGLYERFSQKFLTDAACNFKAYYRRKPID